MYTIRKEFAFSASHILADLPHFHPCARLHGHNYVVTLELRSKSVDRVGFIKDYRSLDFVKEFIDRELDHRHLNDVFLALNDGEYMNPTAENMAKWLFHKFKMDLPELYAVEVSETPKTMARYEQITDLR